MRSEPNLNLLRRLAEAAAARMLGSDRFPADNPFLHDRQEDLSAARPVGMAAGNGRSFFSRWMSACAAFRSTATRMRRRLAEAAKAGIFFWRRRPARAGGGGVAGGIIGAARQVRILRKPPRLANRRQTCFARKTTRHFAAARDFAAPAAPRWTKPSRHRGNRGAGGRAGSPTSTTSRLLDAKRRAQRRKKMANSAAQTKIR